MAVNMAPQGILSLPVQQVATAQQLGPFMKTYKTTLVRTILGIIFFFVGTVFFFVGAVAGSQIVLLLLGLLCLALVIYLVYTAIQVANRQIHLFQYGIVIEQGNQVQPFPWSQASEVLQSITRNYRNGIYVGTTYLFTLRRIDGYQIKLNNMTKNIAELGPAVAKGITQALVPRALTSLSAGQTLRFTPFSINQQGITNIRNEFLPWAQVQAINVTKGYVQIKKIGTSRNWGNVAVAKIPNFLVLTVVAEEMRRSASGGR
jgi:hypothetical protein